MSDATTVTDAKGRAITVRPLTVLEQVRILRALGPAQAGNAPYAHLVECVWMVDAIDGMPVPKPQSEVAIDAAIQRLGDEGLSAVMAHRTAEVEKAMADAQEAVVSGSAPNPLPPAA